MSKRDAVKGRKQEGRPTTMSVAMQQLMLPLLVAMDATKKGLVAFVQQMGMVALSELLAMEAAQIAGPKGKHMDGRSHHHWGTGSTPMCLGVATCRSRTRTRACECGAKAGVERSRCRASRLFAKAIRSRLSSPSRSRSASPPAARSGAWSRSMIRSRHAAPARATPRARSHRGNDGEARGVRGAQARPGRPRRDVHRRHRVRRTLGHAWERERCQRGAMGQAAPALVDPAASCATGSRSRVDADRVSVAASASAWRKVRLLFSRSNPRTLQSVMKIASNFFLAAAAVISVVTFTRPAWALGPVDIEAAARVGGASSPIKDDVNGRGGALGFGLGGRAGVSIFGIYGGVSAMYYLGGSNTESQSPLAGFVPPGPIESESSWLYGFEGGYSFKIQPLTLRPTVQIGSYTLHYSLSDGGSQDIHNLYVEPGVTALLGFGLWFVGADADIFLTPGLDNSRAAFMANAQVGVKF
jgi:hypothetical protein